MRKLMEQTTVSVQVFPTASTGISGSTGVDMKDFTKVVAKVRAHRLPDQKGEGTITLSLYESTTATVNTSGTAVTAGVVTGSITSASDVYLEKELDAKDLSINDSKRFVYAYVASSTSTVLECSLERAGAVHEPV